MNTATAMCIDRFVLPANLGYTKLQQLFLHQLILFYN